jgi:hypothetical protein
LAQRSTSSNHSHARLQLCAVTVVCTHTSKEACLGLTAAHHRRRALHRQQRAAQRGVHRGEALDLRGRRGRRRPSDRWGAPVAPRVHAEPSRPVARRRTATRTAHYESLAASGAGCILSGSRAPAHHGLALRARARPRGVGAAVLPLDRQRQPVLRQGPAASSVQEQSHRMC